MSSFDITAKEIPAAERRPEVEQKKSDINVPHLPKEAGEIHPQKPDKSLYHSALERLGLTGGDNAEASLSDKRPESAFSFDRYEKVVQYCEGKATEAWGRFQKTGDTEGKDYQEYKSYRDKIDRLVQEKENIAKSICPTECQEAGLTKENQEQIKQETGWSDKIIDNIKNMEQYGVLKNADLVEIQINGRECLVKTNIDLDYADEDGITNRERISRRLTPLDSKTGKPLELHHLGQKANSPLVELTEEEHRTGEYVAGKKNQSLWHDNSVTTEVHGDGNSWDHERKEHWKTRAEMLGGGGLG